MPKGVRCVRSLDEIGDDARIDAIVNLAGEPISNGLWTAAKRRKIIDSRVGAAEACLTLAARMITPPQAIVSASAIGWYGIRGDEELDETSSGSTAFQGRFALRSRTLRQRLKRWVFAAFSFASDWSSTAPAACWAGYSFRSSLALADGLAADNTG